jgi:hypothetical protein
MIVRATNEETLFKEACDTKFEKKWPDRISDEKTSKVNPIATAGQDDGYLSSIIKTTTKDVLREEVLRELQ